MKRNITWYIEKIRGKSLSWLAQRAGEETSNAFFYMLSRVLLYFPGLSQLFLYSVKHIATSGKGSDLCLKKDFLPVPIHFYFPIPDIKELLARDVWQQPSSLVSIEFDANRQIDFLQMISSDFNMECDFLSPDKSIA